MGPEQCLLAFFAFVRVRLAWPAPLYDLESCKADACLYPGVKS
jgi:hypothetical protein